MKIKPSTILKVIGFIGIPVTAFFSAKGQVKAEAEIDELKREKGTPLETSDVIKIEAKSHILTIVSGLATIAAHAGAYSIDAKTLAGLVALVGTGGYALNEYKDKLRTLVGNDKFKEIESKIKETVSLDRLKNNPPKLTSPAPEIASGRKLYFDALTKSWFTSEPEKVTEAILDLEHMLNKDGEVKCTQWIKSLGIENPVTEVKEDDGWTIDYLYDEWGCESTWIDVYLADQKLEDGTPYTAIYIYQEPVDVEMYMEAH